MSELTDLDQRLDEALDSLRPSPESGRFELGIDATAITAKCPEFSDIVVNKHGFGSV